MIYEQGQPGPEGPSGPRGPPGPMVCNIKALFSKFYLLFYVLASPL